MKLLILTFNFLLLINAAAAIDKSDTLYYNKEWDECSKDLAFYFGIKDLDENKTGIGNYYYLTGEKHSLRERENGSLNGKSTWWYKNGQVWCVGYYLNGKENGRYTYWHSNGKLDRIGTYENGELKKDWKYFDEDGIQIYGTNVDEPPLFKGAKNRKKSEKYLLSYLKEHTIYPEVPKEKRIEGRIMVGFTVDETGKVINVKIKEGINYFLNEEAIKVVEELPNWKPAVVDGENVRARFTLPINFHITD